MPEPNNLSSPTAANSSEVTSEQVAGTTQPTQTATPVVSLDESSNAPVFHSQALEEQLIASRAAQQAEFDQTLRQVVQYSRYAPKHTDANTNSAFTKADQPILSEAALGLDKPLERKSNWRRTVEFVIFLVVAYAVLWAVRSAMFDSYDVPSGSMENTVMTSDKLFVQRVEHFFGYNPKGAIVVFDDPMVDGRLLLKRIVAVAGDTVDFRDGKLIVNGTPQIEPYTEGKESLPARDAPPLDNIPLAEGEEDYGMSSRMGLYYPYKIPAGYVWCMGDNRTYSQDSRYFGPVAVDTIIGRAWLAYTGFDDFRFL